MTMTMTLSSPLFRAGLLLSWLQACALAAATDSLTASSDCLSVTVTFGNCTIPGDFFIPDAGFANDSDIQSGNNSSQQPEPLISTTAPLLNPVVIPLLSPIASGLPPFPQVTHPLQPVHVSEDILNRPIHTNKFYSDWFLKDGTEAIHAQPYQIHIATGAPYGVEIDQSNHQIPGGTGWAPNTYQFYINVFMKNIGFGSTEWVASGAQPTMIVDQQSGVGAHLYLFTSGTNSSSISFPVVRGMAYVSAYYSNLTPHLTTDAAILGFTRVAAGKWRLTLNNGRTWVIYAICPSNVPVPELAWSGNEISGTSGVYTGYLRAAAVANSTDESILDISAGVVALSGELDAGLFTNTSGGYYAFKWNVEDLSGNTPAPLLHFAFPHQQDIFASEDVKISSATTATNLSLSSTTKGLMRAYTTPVSNGISLWMLVEPELPTIEFGAPNPVRSEYLSTVIQAIKDDLNADFSDAGQDPSNYFGGKLLAKYAWTCFLASEVLKDQSATRNCLDKLEQQLGIYVSNQQINSLRYESTWKGVVGSSGLADGQSLSDFGSSFYNDHHFHYGYLIVASAIVHHLDPSWRANDLIAWTDSLIRDVTNPDVNDPLFPAFRAFDWFSGHSWSRGLFVSGDGKDQESTSEEINFFYGMKLWGLATNRTNIAGLANLMLAVNTRSIRSYFLMESTNKNQPSWFIGNKVTGIYFENKIDCVTWFGRQLEYIQGIQMIPMTPIMEYVWTEQFATEDWALLKDIAPGLTSAWKSLIYTSRAFTDVADAFSVLSDQATQLDSGLMRSFALYWAATRPN